MDLASVKAFEWLLLSVFTIYFHTHSLTAQSHRSGTKHHQHNLGQQMQRRKLTQQTDICKKKQAQETNKRKVHRMHPCILVSYFCLFSATIYTFFNFPPKSHPMFFFWRKNIPCFPLLWKENKMFWNVGWAERISLFFSRSTLRNHFLFPVLVSRHEIDKRIFPFSSRNTRLIKNIPVLVSKNEIFLQISREKKTYYFK